MKNNIVMTPSLEGKRCSQNSLSKAAITNKPPNLTGLMQKRCKKKILLHAMVIPPCLQDSSLQIMAQKPRLF